MKNILVKIIAHARIMAHIELKTNSEVRLFIIAPAITWAFMVFGILWLALNIYNYILQFY